MRVLPAICCLAVICTGCADTGHLYFDNPESRTGIRAAPAGGVQPIQTSSEVKAWEFARRGDYYQRMSDLQRAEAYYRKALAALRSSDSPVSQGAIRNNLAQILDLRGKFDEAITRAQEALEHNQQAGDLIGITVSYTVLGDTYGHQDDIAQRNNFWNKAYGTAQQSKNQQLISGIESRLTLIEERRQQPAARVQSEGAPSD
mgnify:CR=1 FL=1|jgi:tetratricopeptide (TPR) repeat protein